MRTREPSLLENGRERFLCGSNIATKVGTPSYGTNDCLIWRYSASTGCLTSSWEDARGSKWIFFSTNVFWQYHSSSDQGKSIICGSITAFWGDRGYDFGSSNSVVRWPSSSRKNSTIRLGGRPFQRRERSFPAISRVGSIRPNDRVSTSLQGDSSTGLHPAFIVRQRLLCERSSVKDYYGEWSPVKDYYCDRPSPKAISSGLVRDSYLIFTSVCIAPVYSLCHCARKIYVFDKFRPTYHCVRSYWHEGQTLLKPNFRPIDLYIVGVAGSTRRNIFQIINVMFTTYGIPIRIPQYWIPILAPRMALIFYPQFHYKIGSRSERKCARPRRNH